MGGQLVLSLSVLRLSFCIVLNGACGMLGVMVLFVTTAVVDLLFVKNSDVLDANMNTCKQTFMCDRVRVCVCFVFRVSKVSSTWP